MISLIFSLIMLYVFFSFLSLENGGNGDGVKFKVPPDEVRKELDYLKTDEYKKIEEESLEKVKKNVMFHAEKTHGMNDEELDKYFQDNKLLSYDNPPPKTKEEIKKIAKKIFNKERNKNDS